MNTAGYDKQLKVKNVYILISHITVLGVSLHQSRYMKQYTFDTVILI